MSSEPDALDTTDEVKDCFVGIDPDDTDQVKFKGAVFTVKVIPSGIWGRLNAERGIAFQASMRRTIKRLRDAGMDPDELVWTEAKDGVDVTRAAAESSDDPHYLEEFFAIQMEAVKWGVAAHAGFVNRRSEPYPMTRVDVVYGGETWKVMDATTLRLYRANRRLGVHLWLALFKLNELGKVAKKD